MRVVLDTNVLVPALVFPGGPPEAVFHLALEGSIQLVTSSALLLELARVLAEKFARSEGAAAEAVGSVAAIAMIVPPRERVRKITEDPADNRVLEAASAGEADRIVSGDRHLLRLKRWRGIRIQSPAAFLTELQEK